MPMQTKCGLHFDKILLKPLFTEEKKKKKKSILRSQEILKYF